MYKPWTRKEEARAAKMRRCGCPAWLIARVLGRGEQAVRVRLYDLGVRVRRGQGELQALVRKYNAIGWYDWEIADHLNLSVRTVLSTRQLAGIAANDKAQSARRRAGWQRIKASA